MSNQLIFIIIDSLDHLLEKKRQIKLFENTFLSYLFANAQNKIVLMPFIPSFLLE